MYQIYKISIRDKPNYINCEYCLKTENIVKDFNQKFYQYLQLPLDKERDIDRAFKIVLNYGMTTIELEKVEDIEDKKNINKRIKKLKPNITYCMNCRNSASGYSNEDLYMPCIGCSCMDCNKLSELCKCNTHPHFLIVLVIRYKNLIHKNSN